MSHFYERNSAGEVIPHHFVPMTSRPGESRPTRIADARKAGWYPSVTTIQGLLDKPALTDWKVQEHLKTAYRAYKGCGLAVLNADDFIAWCKRETQEALDKAPKDGTDFHDSMQAAYSAGAIENDAHRAMASTVMSDIEAHTGIVSEDFEPELSFVNLLGFAGKVDLHTAACAEGWVIDYKTKSDATKWKPGRMAYPEHVMQLAAYRVGLNLPNARCANVFVCLENGEVDFHEHTQDSLDTEWASFTDLLRIWLRRAQYIPGSL